MEHKNLSKYNQEQIEAQKEITKLNQEIIKLDDTLFIISDDPTVKHKTIEHRAYLLEQIEEIKALNNL